jgi:type I restriction enzyme R subunit
VPFVFASNGHLFVEYDRFTGLTTAPRALAEFPAPSDLRARYEQAMGFSLDSPLAKPLLVRYSGGEATRRYYQDAAIRAVLERLARGEKRALLSLATGAGKTFIAVNLLKRIADAGQLRRALFVCDRDELRAQGLGAFQGVFGADAAEVGREPDGQNKARNARIHVTTYQTLDVDTEEATANFLTTHYPQDYFSHIIIDECHRSAWGKWSQVLTRNPGAVQIGLTATPRELEVPERSKEAIADARISADNLRHFGPPAYEYDLAQGIEDGYLAACEIHRFDIFHDNKEANERVAGIAREDLSGKKLTDLLTGASVDTKVLRAKYDVADLEDRLVMPDRVTAMTQSLFEQLVATGGPEQKTIVFCARDRHADAVAAAMNNLYAEWCRAAGKPRAEPYAFKCTAASGGTDFLPDLRGASRHHFVATTVELLTTGVDVPAVRNIVFFKYVRSPIAFYQMVGRGTRIDAPSGKLMFRIFDYTDATRLFGEAFRTKLTPPRKPRSGVGPEPPPPEPAIQVEGFDVRVTDAGRYVVTMIDGKAQPITVEEYRERIASRLTEAAPTLDAFRAVWVNPAERKALLGKLPDGGRSVQLVRALDEKQEFDLYDVLGDLGYGMAPRTRVERADAFGYKNAAWLEGIAAEAAATVRAIASQFARGGTEGLENPQVFEVPEVARAGGIGALRKAGKPAEVLRETKERMFAA